MEPTHSRTHGVAGYRDAVASNVRRVGVCGSGIMGAGLAEVAARAGLDVVVRSRSADAAAAMVTTIDRGLSRQVAKEKLTGAEKESILARITTTTSLDDLADCDLVIESIVEEMSAKLELFAALDRVVSPDAILATNTSTLSVGALATATSHPGRVVGVHFFNPAVVMPLVEIVRPDSADEAVVARALDFARECGKRPVLVRDRAGFIVNALLFPYLNDAVRMLEAGTASLEDIDEAMVGGCNFPMGPFSLLDLVGLDTTVSILEALHAEFGEDRLVPAPTLRRLVADGRLGRKSGSGFFDYPRS